MLYSLLTEIVFNRWSVHSLNIFDYIHIALIGWKAFDSRLTKWFLLNNVFCFKLRFFIVRIHFQEITDSDSSRPTFPEFVVFIVVVLVHRRSQSDVDCQEGKVTFVRLLNSWHHSRREINWFCCIYIFFKDI
jgi:hypothetical protein